MNEFLKVISKLSVLQKHKAVVFSICLVFSAIMLNAQNIQIKGTVTDGTTKEPLPGVNIVVEGTTIGVTTNLEGQYTISVPSESSVLVFSFISYLTERVPVQGKTEINISLAPDIKVIDEVVVIGYGSVKKKDLTGSVSSVGGEKLKDIPIASAAEALTGKLAGVQITSTEGSPDADIKIRVRGGGSITQDNSPLYIVDGFPVNSISDISPADIATIDVLKDASSTAIYGSRGANGVIIVTTKTAKEGKVTVNYNAYYGQKKIARTLDVLTPYDFVKWQYELALLRDDVQGDYETYFGAYSDMDLYENLKGNDWQKQIFGKLGTTSNHSLSVNGGTEKSQFNFSYNRIDEKTIMLASNYQRDNLNFKLNVNPNRKVSLNFSARYSETGIRGSGANEQNEKSSADSRLKHAVIYTPIPLRNITADTDEEDQVGSLYPPSVSVYDNDKTRNRKNFNLGTNFSWEFIKGLKLRTELGTEYNWDDQNRFYGLTTYYVQNQSTIRNLPAIQLNNDYEYTIRNANTLSYELKNRGNGHNLVLLLGEETNITKSVAKESLIEGFPDYFDSNKAFRFTTEGESQYFEQYYNPDNKLLSFFGRANYDFNGKYLATVTFRADGSSKFGNGNKWGYFPSVALAWRLSDETFMKSMEWLDNLKVRVSFGSAGNNRIPSGQILRSFSSESTPWLSTTNSIWVAGEYMPNEKLKWETTYTRNIGLDFGIFRSRISGSVELYYNNTIDLLLPFPIPGSGYSFQYQNIGETSNKGLEVTLNSVVVNNKDFEFNFSFNIGFNRNNVEDLNTLENIQASSGWASSEITHDYLVTVGNSVGKMYGYKTLGRYGVDEFTWNGSEWIANEGVINNENFADDSWGPGALKLADISGNDTIGQEDMTYIGDANPLHTGGFSLSGRYKNFDFAANFNWSYGNDIYNANKIEFTSTSKYSYRNMIDIMEDGKRWTNIDENGNRVTDPTILSALNANTTMWSPLTSKYVFHSWAVEDGSFLRLSSFTLGYTIPGSILNKIYIKQFRVYATAYNIFCLTKYSGYDPEVDTRRKSQLTPGVDYSAFPRSRSLVFGINLSF